jgi:hypothetical protein
MSLLDFGGIAIARNRPEKNPNEWQTTRAAHCNNFNRKPAAQICNW